MQRSLFKLRVSTERGDGKSRKLPHHTPTVLTKPGQARTFAQLTVSRVVDNPWASTIFISHTEPSSMAALLILKIPFLCKNDRTTDHF